MFNELNYKSNILGDSQEKMFNIWHLMEKICGVTSAGLRAKKKL